MAGMLWVKLYQRQKLKRDLTALCDREDPTEALREVLRELDLSMPMWLPRHWEDWARHGMTRFAPDHFLESVPFDYLEITYFDPDDRKPPQREWDDD